MTANEHLRDLILSHQIGINRLANREARRALSILGRIERELVRILRDDRALSGIAPSTFRLERMLAELERVVPQAYKELHGYLRKRLVEMGIAEAEITEKLIGRAVGPQVVGLVGGVSVPKEFFVHLARSRPFQGKLLRNWARRLEANTRRAIAAAVREGIKEGWSVQKVARAIRGSRAAGYTDGILQKVTRQQAEAMVRTATQHIMQGARQKAYQSSELVKGYQWLSTLDLRTTLEWCVPRDGLTWTRKYEPIGHGYSWGAGPGRVHWNCRSSFTAVLKSWQELGIDAKELSGGTRASMDGQVARTTTAEAWLKGRSESELQRVFGVKRAALFKSGKLSVEDMVKRDGGLIRLRDLKDAA